jgi:hypothetical protein
MGRLNLSARQAGVERTRLPPIARSLLRAAAERGVGSAGVLLKVVEDADAELVRRVILVDRQARLRIEQRIDRAAVEVAVADVERRAWRELEAKPGGERPGHRVGGRVDRPVPELRGEGDVGLWTKRLPLRIDPNLRKWADSGEVGGICLAVGGLVEPDRTFMSSPRPPPT